MGIEHGKDVKAEVAAFIAMLKVAVRGCAIDNPKGIGKAGALALGNGLKYVAILLVAVAGFVPQLAYVAFC